jgi:hypothetical protein
MTKKVITIDTSTRRQHLVDVDLSNLISIGTGVLHIYVDSAFGDDTNDGLSQLSAIQTLGKAETMIPFIVTNPVVIHLKGLDYVASKFRKRTLAEWVYFIADKDWDSTVETTISTGTTGASTGAQVVKDSGLIADSWNGYTVELTSGAANGARRTIRNNTTTDIVPCITFSPVPGVGDSYKITRWNTCRIVFNTPAATSESFFEGTSMQSQNTAQSGGYCFIGVGLAASNSTARPIFSDCNYAFFGCEKTFDGATADYAGWFPSFFRSNVGFGAIGNIGAPIFLLNSPISLSNANLWLGWGAHQDASDRATFALLQDFNFLILIGEIRYQSNGDSKHSTIKFIGRIAPPSASSYTAGFGIFHPATGVAIVGSSLHPATQLVALSSDDAIHAGTLLGAYSAYPTSVRIDNAELSTVTGACLRVTTANVVLAGDVTGQPSGAGLAVAVNYGGKLLLPTAPALGHASNLDWDVGNGSAQNKGYFSSAASMINLFTLSSIIRIP